MFHRTVFRRTCDRFTPEEPAQIAQPITREGFWVMLGVAIMVPLVPALRRRRPGSSLRDWVLRPEGL